jgi:hypothetical protein
MLKSIKREKFSSVVITNAHTLHNKNIYSSQILLYLREDPMKDNNCNVLQIASFNIKARRNVAIISFDKVVLLLVLSLRENVKCDKRLQ